MPVARTVTTEQIAKAIEIGGYPIAKGHFFKSHTAYGNIGYSSDADLEALPQGDLVEACALGQAALNMGVSVYSLSIILANTGLLEIREFIQLNDKTNRTLQQLARSFRKAFRGKTFEVKEFDFGKIFTNYQGRKV